MTEQQQRPIADPFQGFIDQWSFHKAIHEDDWNEGQNYTVKVKQATKDANFATTLKFGRPATSADADLPDAPPATTVKVSAEEKVNLKFAEAGGWDLEAKYKNDGSVSFDVKTTALKKTEIEGLQDAKIQIEGKASFAKMALPTVGVTYSNADVDWHAKSNLSTRDALDLGFIYRLNATNTIGGHTIQAFNFQNASYRFVYSGVVKDAGINYAATYQARQTGGLSSGAFTQRGHTYYLGASNGSNIAAGNLNWDGKKLKSALGVQLNQDDHTWKFRLHDSGSLRALLQWKLHRTTKASINTTVDLNDIARGSLQSPLAWGLNFEVKY